MKSSSPSPTTEKRVLWEVRQRYNVASGLRKPGAARSGAVPAPASRVAPARSSGESGGIAQSPPPRPPRLTRPRRSGRGFGRWVWRAGALLILCLLLSGGIFGYRILAASNKISTTERSLVGQLKDLFFSQGKVLAGEQDDRINILLLAVGGAGHQGQDLADTIMVASVRPSDGQVALLSIPRDLYVQIPGEEYYTKINGVHAHGESQKTGHGPELLQQKVEDITGLPIHYYGRVDFVAFKQIIDAVGGVTITIDNTFFDYWHKISFSAGTEKMDGERALAYVRARYIEGPEGGDFKRAARQQQVLLALQDKVFSVNTALDFTALNAILNSLSDNIRTDLELWEMRRFYELARHIDRSHVRSAVLTTGPQGMLVGATEVLGGTPASVLKPRTGDYSEIRRLAADIFTTDQVATVSSPDPNAEPTPSEPEVSPEPSATPSPAASVSVEIRNGTNVTGLAKGTADDLKAKGYTIVAVGNAVNRATEKTTVYATTSTNTDQAQAVAEELQAAADTDAPDGERTTTADVLVILGADAT